MTELDKLNDKIQKAKEELRRLANERRWLEMVREYERRKERGSS